MWGVALLSAWLAVGEFAYGAVPKVPGHAPISRHQGLPARESSRYTAVPNGEDWYDTDGEAIGAWGGNVYLEDSMYYWVGQSVPSITNQTSPALVKYVGI
jgi:hypothetical protein